MFSVVIDRGDCYDQCGLENFFLRGIGAPWLGHA